MRRRAAIPRAPLGERLLDSYAGWQKADGSVIVGRRHHLTHIMCRRTCASCADVVLRMCVADASCMWHDPKYAQRLLALAFRVKKGARARGALHGSRAICALRR